MATGGAGIIVSLDLQTIEDALGVVKDVDMHRDVHGYKMVHYYLNDMACHKL